MYRALVALAVLTALVNVGRGQFTTIINLPPDPVPAFIDSNTQLNLFDGGILPNPYRAPFQAGLEDGSSMNVQVNVYGGSVDWFTANAGSDVTIFPFYSSLAERLKETIA